MDEYLNQANSREKGIEVCGASKLEVQTAEVVLPCDSLEETLNFFVTRCGFQLESISPADDPACAVIQGHGLRLRLDREVLGSAGTLRLYFEDADAIAGGNRQLIAPNGTRVDLFDVVSEPYLPPLAPSLVLTRSSNESLWQFGRAGMRYRDLLPGRQGGRFIASHIHIPGGGSVPDYVHFHKVRFQIIYCYRGWVRVVYEDQGAPFVMYEGDCVLQPSGIRHRVLESAPELEVIEVASPGEHETFTDTDLELPTSVVDLQREYSGQCFVHHQANAARWQSWWLPGFESRDTGVAQASKGLVSVQVARLARNMEAEACSHDGELMFFFVLQGEITLHCEGEGDSYINTADAFTVPAGLPFVFSNPSKDLELLEVTLPAKHQIRHHQPETLPEAR